MVKHRPVSICHFLSLFAENVTFCRAGFSCTLKLVIHQLQYSLIPYDHHTLTITGDAILQ